MRLVIAEKPSVAIDLAKVMDPGTRRAEGHLAGKYATWTWALGHLVELRPPEAYRPELQGRWRLDLLPVVPEHPGLQPRAGRSDQLGVIRRLIAQAEEVVVATDAGREGELIWEYIAELCGWQGPTCRLWLSESTPAAVRAAFAGLRPPMADLAQAARARAQADWLVGMNATMALSARHGGLWSAGRVQTPTLALLCAREAEIRAFRPEGYFVILGTFEAEGTEAPRLAAAHPEGGTLYHGRWFRGKADRLSNKEDAEAIAAKVRGRTGRVVSVQRKETREQPPRLLHLTDLQRAANARYGLTAAATLKAAQALYEQHKALTYPRTDSRHVSGETFATFPARLRAVRGELAPLANRLAEELPHPGKRVVDDSKVSDHHALLPTAQAPDPARLSPDEAKVYDLVVRRFLAVLLPAAVYADTEAITEVADETFRSRARVLLFAGWREAEPPKAVAKTLSRRGAVDADAGEPDPQDGAGDNDPDAGDLAALRDGQPSRCLSAKAEARETKPPARYSEATLLRAMEHAGKLVDDEELADIMREHGLGTPATRAAIIETLIKREYVTRQKRALVPTPRGEQLVAVAPPELRQPETTGEWERRLRAIEGGTEAADAFLAGIADLTRRIVADVAGQQRAAPAPSPNASLGTCPRCGGAVTEGKKGFGCANWRPEAGACRWVIWKRVAGKDLTAGQARELLTAGETKRPVKGFQSKAGKRFEARLRLDRDSGRIAFLFDQPPAAAPVGPPAPAPAAATRRPRPAAASTPDPDGPRTPAPSAATRRPRSAAVSTPAPVGPPAPAGPRTPAPRAATRRPRSAAASTPAPAGPRTPAPSAATRRPRSATASTPAPGAAAVPARSRARPSDPLSPGSAPTSPAPRPSRPRSTGSGATRPTNTGGTVPAKTRSAASRVRPNRPAGG